MKKILLYSLTLAAAASMLSACNESEDLIFEDSAANRLDAAKVEMAKVLTDQGGKWAMEYFSNPDEQGYNYVLEFAPNGEVTITTNHMWTTPANTTLSQKSLWEVISDNGVVLSFNTYNPLLHVFADPDDYQSPTQSENESPIDHTADGHLGDYEFIYIDTEDDGNTLRLKGKKRGYYIMLRRLPADTDPAEYIASAIDAEKNMFSSKIKEVYMTMPDGRSFSMVNSSSIVTAWPTDGDKITQSSTANAIITPGRMRFMEPFGIANASGVDSVYVQSFVLQSDGSLMCDDAGNEGITISAGPLANLFAGQTYEWRNDVKAFGGFYADKYTTLLNEIKAKDSGSFRWMGFVKDAKTGYFTLFLSVKMKVNKNTVNATFVYNFEAALDGNKATLRYVGPADDTSANYLAAYPSLQAILSQLSTTVSLSTTNAMAPLVMTVATADADYMTINLQQ